MKGKISFWIAVLLLPMMAHARKGQYSPEVGNATGDQGPWFTGPLLTGSAHIVPKGHYNIEPYLFVTTVIGQYNAERHVQTDTKFYNVAFQLPMQVGIADKMDVSAAPGALYNRTEGVQDFQFADIPVGIDLQILSNSPQVWYPAIRLGLKGNLPVGKYEKLNPNKLGTDIGGNGSWLPGLALTFGKLFHFGGEHYLNSRLNIAYVIPTAVPISGFNIYGGGFGAQGKVYPGNYFDTSIGLEFSFTKHWVFAIDAFFRARERATFKGTAGTKLDGSPARVGSNSSEQMSLAPAFEYNWNGNVGIIAGVWFTIFGRNASDFVSGVVAVNFFK